LALAVSEELLSEHLDALFRTALRLCAGHTADAEDLLQDAALRALEGYRQLRDPTAGRGCSRFSCGRT
jgi:DNA-directed RNA polymerase specialized sigma24 family protein